MSASLCTMLLKCRPVSARAASAAPLTLGAAFYGADRARLREDPDGEHASPPSPWTSSFATARRCACAPRPGRRRRAARVLPRPLAAEPVQPLPRACRRSTPTWSSRCSGGRRRKPRALSASSRTGSSRSRTSRGFATRRRPRSRSPSPTTTSAAGSGHGCSSSSRLSRRARGSSASSRTVLPDNRQMLGVFEAVGFAVTRDVAGGEVELDLPDRADRALSRERREPRPRSRRRVAPPVLRAVVGRGDRRVAATRLDRRRALSQHPRRRLHGRGVSGQPPGRVGRGSARLQGGRGDPGSDRPRGDLRSGRARAGCCRGRARERRSRALRHLRGVRRGRLGGRRAPGAAARARALARRADDRPELPWHRLRRHRA